MNSAANTRESAIVDMYGLSPMQAGILFHTLLEEGSSAYFVQTKISLHGDVNVERMAQTYRQILARHDAFRTAIVHDGVKQPVQIVLRQREGRFAFHDLRGMDEVAQARALDDRLSADRQARFALDRDVLFRAMLLRLADDRHCLVLSFHHIIVDGWCINLLIEDFQRIYRDLAQGREPEALPSPPFKHYIRWVQKQDRDSALAHWQRYLAGCEGGTQVPKNALAEPGAAYVNKSQYAALGPERTTALQALCRELGVTLNSVLQMAWAMALQRYNGSTDVVFGCVTSGRSDEIPNVESMVGMLINTLPVRIQTEAGTTFAQAVRQVQADLRDGERHGHLPLSEIQRFARAEGALFDSLFVFQNLPDRQDLDAGFTVAEVDEIEQTNYDFNLIFKVGRDIRITCAYNGARVSDETAAAAFTHLTALVDDILRDAHRPVGTYEITGAAERRQLLEGFNQTARPFPQDDTVCTVFERVAQAHADKLAVYHQGESLSYRALNARANQLARYLRSRGLGAGDIIGLMPGRSIDMLVCLLGVLKSGAAYVPLDAAMPAQRIRHIVEDAAVRLLLVSGPVMPELACGAESRHLHDIDLASLRDDKLDACELAAPIDPLMPAYVIYTSGSTGAPKGVLVSHRNVVNLNVCFQHDMGFKDERMTQFAPFTFDAAAGEIFVTLLGGSSLFIIPTEIQQEVDQIQSFLIEHGITFASFPPDLFAYFDPARMGKLRCVLTAGSRPNKETIGKWLGRVTYINAYGPTETTVLSTAWISSRDRTSEDHISIGLPMSNTSTYVLDGQLKLVPRGVPGELCIGGAGVALGYLGKPELTAEKFVCHPYVPGERIYRTGDLVRQHADGSFEFLGRLDFQTKIRGHRVEPEEVERAMLAHPLVKEAAVLAAPIQGVNSLIAYYTLHEGQALDGQALRAFLAACLPAYMVPAYYVPMADMPLTSHFKVDRKALPSPSQAITTVSASGQAHAEPPQGDLEQLVCGIWREILAVDGIGRHDNFFTVGGDSIKAIQIVSRIRKAGHRLSVAQVMQSPTVAALAAALAHNQAQTDACEAAKPDAYTPFALANDTMDDKTLAAIGHACGLDGGAPVRVLDAMPLSPMQAGMLYYRMLTPDSSAYVGQVHMVIDGHIDPDRLKRTCEQLIARHEALRTAVVAEGVRKPVQVVLSERAADCRYQDLRDEPDVDQALARLIEADRARGFDLARDTLLRMALYQAGAQRQHLLVSAHHIVLDGWSMGRIVEDFVEIYAAISQQRAPQLTHTRPYSDYLWWRARRQDSQAQQARAHWQDHLRDFDPRPMLPQARRGTSPGTNAKAHRNRIVRREIDRARTAALIGLAKRLGVTLNSLFQAMWATLLQRYNGNSDIAFGCVVSGRGIELDSAQDVVGLMITSVPLRVTQDAGQTFDELARWTNTRFADNEKHGYIGLPDIQSCAGIAEPLFDHLFVFENFPITDLRADDFRVLSREVIDETNYDFNLVINPGETIGIVIACNEAIWDAEHVERIVGHLDGLVSEVIRDPSQRLDEIAFLTLPERQQVLVDFNSTARPAEPARTFKQWFETQAALTPDAVAVVFEGRQLSYAQLDRQANRLAHFLVEQHVTAGAMVGVVSDKSIEALVGILAVQKLGGAYVPIASGWPVKRALDVIEQTRMPFLLYAAQAPAHLLEPMLPGLRAWSLADICVGESVQETQGKVHALAAYSTARLPDTQSPDDTCYLMFTSGTTGKPKGIINTQRNVDHLVHELRRTYYAPGKGVIQVAAWHFDACVMDLFGALACGATIYLCDPSPRSIISLLTGHATHELLISPSILREIVGALGEEDRRAIRALARITCGGEPLDYQLLRRARDKLGEGVRFTNIYGPTETTVFCTHHEVSCLDTDQAVVEIGQPIGNMRAYVLDARLAPCPIGVVGEVCMAGPGVARGYANDPEASARSFLPSPFEPGHVLYRTGDRARWNSEGVLEIIGRVDAQTKVRGYRVELSEVRSALLQHPDLEEAAVIAHAGDGGQVLAAFVVPRKGLAKALSESEVCRFLMTLLPDYMVPASITALDTLPSTANHKIDTAALRKMAMARRDQARTSAPLDTEMERHLARLFQQILACQAPGADDNFFALGGNSLKGIELVSLIKAELGLAAEMSHLYIYPTLRSLAACYAQLQAAPQEEANSHAGIQAQEAELMRVLPPLLAAVTRTSPGEGQAEPLPHRILRTHREDGSVLLGVAVLDEAGLVDAHVLTKGLHTALAALMPHHVAVLPDHVAFQSEDYWSIFSRAPSGQELEQRVLTAMSAFLHGFIPTRLVQTYSPSPRQKLALKRYGVRHLSQNNADMRIHLPCEPAQFEAVLREVTRRHAMLRTVVGQREEGGDYELREYADDNCYSLTVLDLSDMDHDNQQRRIQQLIRDISLPFDLTRAPLHRALLIRENHRACRLIWTFSHFISDGECGKLMASEFYKLFDAAVAGRQAVLPEIGSSHQAYVSMLARQQADLPDRAVHRHRQVAWMAQVRAVKRRMAAFHEPASLIRFRTFEVLMPSGQDDNPMDTAYGAFIQAAATWLDLREVPVGDLYHGRRYGSQTYFNMVGDYHDRLPLLVPVHPTDARQTLAAMQEARTGLQSDTPNYFGIADSLIEENPGWLDDVMNVPFFFNFSELVTYLRWNDGERYQHMLKEHTLVPEGIYDGQSGLLMHRISKDKLHITLVGHQLQAQPFEQLAGLFRQCWRALSTLDLQERQADGLVM